VPLCGLVLISNLASLLLAGWFPAAAEVFNHAGWFGMECIRVSSHWFAAWPKAYVYVPAPSLLTTALYYGLLFAILTGWLFRRERRVLKGAAVTAALAMWSWHGWQGASVTRLTVLALNGGTAIYCDRPGQKNDLLIDAGTTNTVQFTTKAFLRGQGVNRLPALLLTHGDLHHVGGAEMAADLFRVQQICASPVRFRSTTYRRTLEHFQATPARVRSLSRGDTVGDWTVLHPAADDRFSRADDGAMVLSGAFSGCRVLLLSDLGREGQDALLARTENLRADIVVAGLPSAREPLCDALLDAIQPRLIVIADSEFPVSERAGVKLRERLAARKVPVIYTRFAGTATVEFRARDWKVRTMSGPKVFAVNPAGT
jgi:beta-lactamase superfamily II metal-dependent hydrolase